MLGQQQGASSFQYLILRDFSEGLKKENNIVSNHSDSFGMHNVMCDVLEFLEHFYVAATGPIM